MVRVIVRSPNARAKLRASQINCERSELPKVARQLQRSLGGWSAGRGRTRRSQRHTRPSSGSTTSPICTKPHPASTPVEGPLSGFVWARTTCAPAWPANFDERRHRLFRVPPSLVRGLDAIRDFDHAVRVWRSLEPTRSYSRAASALQHREPVRPRARHLHAYAREPLGRGGIRVLQRNRRAAQSAAGRPPKQTT
jgi:hypothetical protein